MTPEERYERDPMFHSLVNALRFHIKKMELTPTEVREAAVLACYFHEMEEVPRRVMCYTEIRDRLIRTELERSDK
jgi:hypothetical protein